MFQISIVFILKLNGAGMRNIKMCIRDRYYMDKYGKSRNEMCNALGVKYTTFTDWVKGNSYPRIDKIELMANYFGISKADLVEDRCNNISSHHKGCLLYTSPQSHQHPSAHPA